LIVGFVPLAVALTRDVRAVLRAEVFYEGGAVRLKDAGMETTDTQVLNAHAVTWVTPDGQRDAVHRRDLPGVHAVEPYQDRAVLCLNLALAPDAFDQIGDLCIAIVLSVFDPRGNRGAGCTRSHCG